MTHKYHHGGLEKLSHIYTWKTSGQVCEIYRRGDSKTLLYRLQKDKTSHRVKKRLLSSRMPKKTMIVRNTLFDSISRKNGDLSK